MKKRYRIVGKTNPYIAQRDIHFKGKTEITIANDLSLKEAQKKLLDFYNEDYDTFYPNWGLVARYGNGSRTAKDGTRRYEYDSRYYIIEEDTPNEFWGINKKSI